MIGEGVVFVIRQADFAVQRTVFDVARVDFKDDDVPIGWDVGVGDNAVADNGIALFHAQGVLVSRSRADQGITDVFGYKAFTEAFDVADITRELKAFGDAFGGLIAIGFIFVPTVGSVELVVVTDAAFDVDGFKHNTQAGEGFDVEGKASLNVAEVVAAFANRCGIANDRAFAFVEFEPASAVVVAAVVVV